tara:strand:- start:39871 stop:40149 length:279 start_codon:yes stop_codon:yes gene_type:complete
MYDNWIRKMLEATWGFNEQTGQLPSNILRFELRPIDIDKVTDLVLNGEWNMDDYGDLMTYFERFDDESITSRMIAINRIIISLLKTGHTNEW